MIDPGVNGAVVRPDDAKAFGDALIELATNPSRLAASGRASLARASTFTVDLMVDRTLDAYLSIAREGTRS